MKLKNGSNKKLSELAEKAKNNGLTHVEQENINKALSNSLSGLASVSVRELEMMQKNKEEELIPFSNKTGNMISINDLYDNHGVMTNKRTIEVVRTRLFWSKLKHYFKGHSIFIPFVKPGLLRDSHGLFDIFSSGIRRKSNKKIYCPW